MPVQPLTPNTPSPLIPANLFAPVGNCQVDPTSAQVFAQGIANYSQITTLATTTVKASPGLYYGFTAVSTGTAAMAWAAYDVLGTASNLLHTITPGALGAQAPGPSGIGVRFTGILVVVTTGTAGTYNALWD